MSTRPPLGAAIRTPLARPQRIALGVALAGYLLAVVFVSCALVRYPADNDLDEIGWIVDHLTLRDPSSLVANEVYPFGLPLVLRVLRPALGVLRGALAWQAVAMTALLLAVFVLARRLFATGWVATCAAIAAGVMTLPLATSEFADGTAAALFIAGAAVAAGIPSSDRASLALGAGVGLACLFRTHYLILLASVPPILVVQRRGVRAVAGFLAGFLATAWPLLAVNLVVYGNPLHAGMSPYYAGQFMTDTLDWNDFPATYAVWPLWRIVRERPLDLMRHMAMIGGELLVRRDVVAAIVLAPVTLWLAPSRDARRHLAFLALIALLYTVVTILPTRYTDRAFAPVAVTLALLIAPAVAHAGARLRPAGLGAMLVLAVVVVLAYQPRTVSLLQQRRWWRDGNQRIVDLLTAHGMTASREVFCNDWDVYNLADPKFISFYNYGGWLLLDPRYAAERPPPRATTREEWEAFVHTQRIRFVVVRRTPETASLFAEPAPPGWQRLGPAPARFRIFAVRAGDPR